MKIRIENFKTHESSTYIRVMLYIDRLIDESSLCGNLNFINLNNVKIAKKYGLTTVDADGVLKMSTDFYDCINVLTHLGILTKTDSYEKYERASKYSIEKHLYLILYCLLLSLNSLSKKQIKTLHKKSFGNNLSDIVYGIYNCTINNTIYKNTLYSSVIKNTYHLLATISKSAKDRYEGDTFIANQYVRYYIDASKDNYFKSAYQTPLRINNSSTVMVPFNNELSKSWFTNYYELPKVNDSKELEEYYEKHLKRNKFIKPIIVFLEKNYNRISLNDLEIPREIFNKIPGSTVEKKTEILCEVVRYWIIKNCPFLNYTIGLVDNLKHLNDNFRMNIHISLIEESNQHGIYAYRIHFAGRMTNNTCKLHKEEHCIHYYESREYILRKSGFDSFLDLHSSIFTIARSLNYHIPLDLPYDIKKKLEDLKIRGTIDGQRRLLKAKDFKGLGFYMFFNRGVESAYNYYKNRYNARFHKILKGYEEYIFEEIIETVLELYGPEKEKLDKTVAKVSERDFYKIYNLIQQETGGTTELTNNIFIIESAIMALAIRKIDSKNCQVKNVYDCIWWNSLEISEEEIRKILISSAEEVFNMFYQISEMPNSLSVPFHSEVFCEQQSC